MPLSLTYNDPIDAVFLRILAWEVSVRSKKDLPKVDELVRTQVQAARKELGLKEIHKGAPHEMLRRLRQANKLTEGSPAHPIEPEWRKENKKAWRLLSVPPHNAVRQLSDKPISTPTPSKTGGPLYKELEVTLRNPAMPKLHVYVGTALTTGKFFEGRRGVYFLRLTKGLYIGQTRELDTRLIDHVRKKNPKWWVFMSADKNYVVDTLEATEALLISFWNEVCKVTNHRRGVDQEPDFVYLQQAVMLAQSVSAVFLWLIREKELLGTDLAGLGLEDWNIPFKKCRGRGWLNGDCYLKAPQD